MFGQRLKLARKRAGLSMQALADRVTPSVSAQAISKYEADKMMPSSSVLVGLGKALGVSLDFLLGGQVEALESVEWRKNSTASAQDRAMAESIVIEKLEDYLAIEGILEMQLAEDPFADLRVDHVDSEEAIDAKAREVRRAWKLGIDPIPSMTALLEDKGLKVIEADLPERLYFATRALPRTTANLIDYAMEKSSKDGRNNLTLEDFYQASLGLRQCRHQAKVFKLKSDKVYELASKCVYKNHGDKRSLDIIKEIFTQKGAFNEMIYQADQAVLEAKV